MTLLLLCHSRSGLLLSHQEQQSRSQDLVRAVVPELQRGAKDSSSARDLPLRGGADFMGRLGNRADFTDV